MTAEDAVAVVRDYLTLTGVRRADLLGSKWPRGHPTGRSPAPRIATGRGRPGVELPGLALADDPLPVGLPTAEAQATLAALPPAVRLSLALRYAVAPLRRAIDQPAAGHRAVPSAAALFPIDVLVISRADGAAYRCDPEAVALVPDARVTLPPTGLAGDGFALMLVARLARCIEPYGDLAPCLAFVEAGMVEAQLALMLGLAGWTVEPRADVLATARIDRHWSDLPVTLLAVSGKAAGQALASLAPRSAAAPEEPERADTEPFERVRRLVEAIGEPAKRLADQFPSFSIERRSRWRAPRCLARAAQCRSSGGSGGPAWRQSITAATLEDLLCDTATLASWCPQPGPARPIVAVAARIGRDDAELFAIDRDGSGTLCRSHRSAQPVPEGISMLVTLGFDHAAGIAQWGAGAYAVAHQAVGRWAQCFCLAAAAHGFVARPLRSFAQQDADASLPLHADAILQIAISAEAPPAPSIRTVAGR